MTEISDDARQQQPARVDHSEAPHHDHQLRSHSQPVAQKMSIPTDVTKLILLGQPSQMWDTIDAAEAVLFGSKVPYSDSGYESDTSTHLEKFYEGREDDLTKLDDPLNAPETRLIKLAESFAPPLKRQMRCPLNRATTLVEPESLGETPGHLSTCSGTSSTISELLRCLLVKHKIFICHQCKDIVRFQGDYFDTLAAHASGNMPMEASEKPEAVKQRHLEHGCVLRCIDDTCEPALDRSLLELAHAPREGCSPTWSSRAVSNEHIWRWISAQIHGTYAIIQPHFEPGPTYTHLPGSISLAWSVPSSRVHLAASMLLQDVTTLVRMRRDESIKMNQLREESQAKVNELQQEISRLKYSLIDMVAQRKEHLPATVKEQSADNQPDETNRSLQLSLAREVSEALTTPSVKQDLQRLHDLADPELLLVGSEAMLQGLPTCPDAPSTKTALSVVQSSDVSTTDGVRASAQNRINRSSIKDHNDRGTTEHDDSNDSSSSECFEESQSETEHILEYQRRLLRDEVEEFAALSLQRYQTRGHGAQHNVYRRSIVLDGARQHAAEGQSGRPHDAESSHDSATGLGSGAGSSNANTQGNDTRTSSEKGKGVLIPAGSYDLDKQGLVIGALLRQISTEAKTEIPCPLARYTDDLIWADKCSGTDDSIAALLISLLIIHRLYICGKCKDLVRFRGDYVAIEELKQKSLERSEDDLKKLVAKMIEDGERPGDIKEEHMAHCNVIWCICENGVRGQNQDLWDVRHPKGRNCKPRWRNQKRAWQYIYALANRNSNPKEPEITRGKGRLHIDRTLPLRERDCSSKNGKIAREIGFEVDRLVAASTSLREQYTELEAELVTSKQTYKEELSRQVKQVTTETASNNAIMLRDLQECRSMLRRLCQEICDPDSLWKDIIQRQIPDVRFKEVRKSSRDPTVPQLQGHEPHMQKMTNGFDLSTFNGDLGGPISSRGQYDAMSPSLVPYVTSASADWYGTSVTNGAIPAIVPMKRKRAVVEVSSVMEEPLFADEVGWTFEGSDNGADDQVLDGSLDVP